MRFRQLTLVGAYLIEPKPFEDNRGSFVRYFDRAAYGEAGLATDFEQCSYSRNTWRGTLRGIHYQRAPHGEQKLVRCSRGRVFDVLVDLRSGSATYAESVSVELADDSPLAIYVPSGVGHGFLTMEDDSVVEYQISGRYDQTATTGVRWNDPDIEIDWPAPPRVLSTRDAELPFLADM